MTRREFDTADGHVTIEFVENEKGGVEEVFTLVSDDGLRTTTYRVPVAAQSEPKYGPGPPLPPDYEPRSLKV